MNLEKWIRTIPDYPKSGIQFRDITTLLLEPKGLAASIDAVVDRHAKSGLDLVAGIEARGFIFGAAIAYRLGIGFVPIRKPGKLPGETLSREYELEYGHDRVEVHKDAIADGQSVLVVDDLIATGGTAEAAVELVREAGGEVAECSFVIALPELGGIQRIEKLNCPVHWQVEFEGD